MPSSVDSHHVLHFEAVYSVLFEITIWEHVQGFTLHRELNAFQNMRAAFKRCEGGDCSEYFADCGGASIYRFQILDILLHIHSG